MRRVLERSYVVSRLADLFRSIDDVEVVILFGSLARCGFTIHDVDIAVKFSREISLLDLGLLASRVAEVLNIDANYVDIINLDQVNPALLFKILNEGIVIKGSEEALKKLVEKASLYPDVLIELKMWSTLDLDPRLDITVIVSRVEEVRRNVRFLKEKILVKRPDELDYGEILALERAVHRIIEAMLDICRHVVSVYSLGLAESYGQYPRKLAQAGLMSRELAEKLSKLIGLRNILVHRYLEIDLDKLCDTAREIVEEIADEFIKWVERLVSTSRANV